MFSRSAVTTSMAIGIILVIIIASTATVVVLNRSQRISTTGFSSTLPTGGFLASRIILTGISQTLIGTSGLSGLTVQSYGTTIPPQYQSQYSSVQNLLNQFNSSLGSVPSSKNSFTYAAELLPANGNQGSALFNANNLNSVETNLNAPKTMGMKGVTIALGYPLLDPTFPDNQQYLQYFKTVVTMCHQEGLTVDVESQVLFANTPYSSLTFDWSKLSYSDYVAKHVAQDNLICSQIKPDILEIGVEADTKASLTGYSQLNTPSGWSIYINQLLNGIDKNGCKLAAGAGDWLTNTTQWVQGFVDNPNLDFVSTHSYPIVSPFLTNLISLGKFAQEHGKRIVFDEEWDTKVLHPVNAGGGGGFGGPAATQQDIFSYWIPIDIEFQQLMAKFCQTYPCEYLSPFPGDYYFFAYLTWNQQLDTLTFFQLHNMLNPTITQNMANFTISPTGAAYATLCLATTSPTPAPSSTISQSPTPSPTILLSPTPSSTTPLSPTPSLSPSPKVPEFPLILLLLFAVTVTLLFITLKRKRSKPSQKEHVPNLP